MQKATAWMQKRFPKLFAEETNPMKKVFTCLCALLAVQDFEVTDGKVTLTEDQTGKIEEHVAQLEKDAKDAVAAEKAAKDAQADLQAKLDKALQDVKDRDEQIANLKKAPGAEDKVPAGEHVDEGAGDITAQSMLNEIKDL